MSDNDLMFRPATELAGMVRSGEVSARELVEISLQRIEELNPALNAFVDVDAERALATAAEIGPGDERPFAGVPVAIKNNRPVQGLRLTYGCRLMAEHVCDYDHNVTRRLRDAGFVIVGTTTLPEYGILPTSEARIFGPTRNPWDLGRTPGGSSGGIGRGGGRRHGARSPRQRRRRLDPHSGRVLWPGRPEARARAHLRGPGTGGLRARHRRDAHAHGRRHRGASSMCSRAMSRAMPRGRPRRPSLSPRAPRRTPGRLRIAATTLAPIAEAVVRPARRTGRRRRAASCCARSGTRWWRSSRRGCWTVCRSCSAPCSPTSIALSIAYSGAVAGREPAEEDMEPMSWAIYSMIQKLGAVQGMAAAVQLQAHSRRLVAFLSPYDALLTPALAERPLPLGTLNTAAPEPMSTFTRSGLFTPFTPVFNASGQPGISLPLYEGEDGLPLGVQLVGRPAGEAALLALAAQLEAALPWMQRRAPEPGAVVS